MNTHYLSPTNPTHVTHAEWYRVTMTRLLTPAHDSFEELQAAFPSELWRPDGYGLAFLESEEHSRLYAGPIEQITDHEADPSTPLDVRQGVVYDLWPNSPAWDAFIPDTTWHPDGCGIITTFEHPEGTDVLVYEFHGRWLPDRPERPLVTFHCTHCHRDTFHDTGKVLENRGPRDRRWAARQARQHVHSAARHGVGDNSQCQLTDPHMMQVVTQVANRMNGTSHPVLSDASMCATTGPCATIRELKVRQAARA